LAAELVISGFALPSPGERGAGDVAGLIRMHNPAPGSRIRSIRAIDLGLAGVDVCLALRRGWPFGWPRGAAAVGLTAICGLIGKLGAPPAFQKEI